VIGPYTLLPSYAVEPTTPPKAPGGPTTCVHEAFIVLPSNT
jgi:hypothetical protein